MNGNDSRLSELTLLKDIAEMLNQGIHLSVILQDVLNQLLKALRLEAGWIFLLNEHQELRLAAAVNLPPGLQNEQFKPMCGQECYCIERFHNGRLKKAVNVMECKRLHDARVNDYGDTCGLVHHASVALRSGNEFVGILNVALSSKELFKKEELALLESVALQIGSAVKRIALTEENRQIAIVEERNRLAQELHDSVKQLLFSMDLLANTGISLSHEQQAKQLFLDISTIAQEAVNNSKKHSGTALIQLICYKRDEKLIVKIIDFGRGFHYNPDAELPSLGLRNMFNRAKKINGIMSIQSAIGKGTEITISLPLLGGVYGDYLINS